VGPEKEEAAMKAVYRKSDGAYVDNAQSWVKVPADLAAAVAEKHGGVAKDYVVFETERPYLKKLLRGKLVEDAAKVAQMAAEKQALVTARDAGKRIERRRLEADLKLAEDAGDDDAMALVQKQLEELG
jgi:hypothetical protein